MIWFKRILKHVFKIPLTFVIHLCLLKVNFFTFKQWGWDLDGKTSVNDYYLKFLLLGSIVKQPRLEFFLHLQ